MSSEPSHPVDRHVGQRLREGRSARNLTQAHLGAELGISAQQVQKYENGSNRISASKLYEIAARFETGIDWFFEGLDPRPAHLAEPSMPYDAPASGHDQTRALIAAFKALPNDAARTEAIVWLRQRAEKT